MKYAVSATITVETKSKRDSLVQSIKEMIVGKLLWADTHNPTAIKGSTTEDGKPAVNVDLRFNDGDSRDTVALFLEDKIVRIPALTGSVTVHKCFHDEVGANKSCEPEVIP